MSGEQRDVTRLETLSDGVFAFSATLLVVSLEVPRRFTELVANLYGFIAFGLTFTALILIWSAHRGFFRRHQLADGWTIETPEGTVQVLVDDNYLTVENTATEVIWRVRL